MATSKCAKCNNTTFESKRGKIINDDNPIVFVQCAKCGSVIGVYDIGSLTNVAKEILHEISLLRKSFPK
jgi:hypothetical protein